MLRKCGGTLLKSILITVSSYEGMRAHPEKQQQQQKHTYIYSPLTFHDFFPFYFLTLFSFVQQQKQKGANDLCADNKRHSAQNPAQSFLSLEASKDAFPQPATLKDDKFLAPIEPPRDYAPKSPSDKGMLDEDYGLSK